MEIADFFVLNKADRAGADQAVMSIQMILNFRKHDGWMPGVVKTVASDGTGIADIAAKVAEHRAFLEQSGELLKKRRQRLKDRIRDLVVNRLRIDFWTDERTNLLEGRMDGVIRLKSTPYDLAEELINTFHHE